MNINQFKHLIIDDTLKDAGMYTPEASDQVLGTGLVESGLHDLRQLPNGPALGPFQMEPATFNDIYYRYLLRKDKSRLKALVRTLLVPRHTDYIVTHPLRQLMTNMPFAVVMARIRYLMVPEPIPKTVDQQAIYWQTHYNTKNRDADIVRYLRRWREYEAQKEAA